MDRFWSKVAQEGDCWVWTAGRKPDGYSQFLVEGRRVYAHRHAYELLVGEVPPGLDLDHLCRNRACVNPDHLEPVTRAENVRRGLLGNPATNPGAQRQLAKSHCPQGHPYSGGNLYTYPNGYRQCRTCHADSQRRRRARRHALAAKEAT